MEENQSWLRKALLFIGGQSVSMFGSSLVSFAIIFYIAAETESGIMLMIASLCSFFPSFIATLFAGVWADRYNKKYLIMLPDLFIAFATLVAAISFTLGYKEIWVLLAVNACRSLGSGVQNPSIPSFLPEFVPDGQLMRINGIHSTISSFIDLLSPAFGAVLIKFAPLEFIFYIDVVTAVIGCGLLFLIKSEYKPKIFESKTTILSEFKEGLLYVKSDRFIISILFYAMAINFLANPVSLLLPLRITEMFGKDPIYLSGAQMGLSIGMLVAGIFISVKGNFKRPMLSMSMFIVFVGIGEIMYGVALPFMVLIIVSVMIGITMVGFNTPFRTIVQSRVDKDKLGRLFSFTSLISSCTIPVSTTVFGLLSDIIAINYIFIGAGLAISIVGVTMMFNKTVQNGQE